jgi:2-dehydropantoate 2-reductase
MSMKIAILGAGAMGSLFGGLLAEAGQQVTLLDINDAHLGAIAAHGLRLETDTGDRRIRNLQAVRPSQATAVPDLLIVFTKSMHTRAALASVRQRIGASTYVLTLRWVRSYRRSASSLA